MRILHTSDWHLGRHLVSKDRKKEHQQFLDWLIDIIEKEKIDCLLIAGDIFDTATPSNQSLTLYFNFLNRLSRSGCRQAVIIAGNHDSVSTINAPARLLKIFNIHVVGGVQKGIEDHIVPIKNDDGSLMAIVCAVPFLRDRDVRKSAPGESYEEKGRALEAGVMAYYRKMAEAARVFKANLSASERQVPVIATGHLFTAGGKASEGVREIYVGSLGRIHADAFSGLFDYVALGHLHIPQTVGGSEFIRYCGSPLPLSFGEAGSNKNVIVADFDEKGAFQKAEAITVPVFQSLAVVKGRMSTLKPKLEAVEKERKSRTVWVEVHLEESGQEVQVQDRLAEMTRPLAVEVLAVKSIKTSKTGLHGVGKSHQTLEALMPAEVFGKRLDAENDMGEAEKKDLMQAFNEIENQVSKALMNPDQVDD